MPIKAENRARYPKDWKQIRIRILERACHKCERCGLDNYAVILRKHDGIVWNFGTGENHADAKQIAADKHWELFGDETQPRITIVVLTIMHLDHIPEHVADDNLQAACQCCHLTYDAKHHAANAQITRRNKNPTPKLFAQ